MYDARGRRPTARPPEPAPALPADAEGKGTARPRVATPSSRPRIAGSAGTWDSCEVAMTKQKTFKRRVRERMEKTGESYASARAALIGEEPAGRAPRDERAAVRARRRRDRDQRAAALIIAGGAGAACMSFRYEAEDFTHFHLSGWNPFQSDIVAAVERLEAHARHPRDRRREDGREGAARARRSARPDRVGRGLQRARGRRASTTTPPRSTTGRLTSIPADELAERRGRIRKQKHRLLAIEPGEPDIDGAVRAGLIACANGPVNPPSPGMSLDGIAAGPTTSTRAGRSSRPASTATARCARSGGHGRRSAPPPPGPGSARGRPRRRGDAHRTNWRANGRRSPDADDLASAVRALHAKEVETVEILKALLL